MISRQLCLLFSFFVCFSAEAQVAVRATVDRDRILIGEPVELTVQAYIPLGTSVQWPAADTIPHFEINKRSAVDTTQDIDNKKILQTYTITSFDSGRWQLPPFEVLVDGRPYFSDSITIDVSFASFDPAADYRDIKDIVATRRQSLLLWPWLVAATVLMGLALYFILRKKHKRPLTKKIEPRISAYDEAMRDLKRIAAAAMDEKEYYISINNVLRNYVSRRFSITTFERTNEELILQLSAMNIPAVPFAKLKQALRVADFVKFAKYSPSIADNKTNIETVRSSIEIMDNSLASAV